VTPGLFDRSEINGLILENRLCRSATWEGLATPEGACTDPLVSFVSRLAEGGVGLIFSSFTYVLEGGRGLPKMAGLDRDDYVPGYHKLTSAVHERGSKIALQLVHAGAQTRTKWIEGHTPLAPSAIEDRTYRTMPREMTLAEIEDVVEAFGQAARRGVEAGFDAVELHGAHGYLLNQFMSPLSNQRGDRYGGSVENRARFACEVYERVRREVGPHFPVLIKMNCDDFLPGGATLDDWLYLAKRLSDLGIDAIEVSGGTPASGKLGANRTGIGKVDKEAYFLPQARRIREAVEVPLILVGGLRSPQLMQQILAEGTVDYFSLSRPFIREPRLVQRWQSGDLSKARCISCNLCFRTSLEDTGLTCAYERKLAARRRKPSDE
jgi:2,4-dienoyl-CoA reductase-like NADH-dependent reductase (Old Yellow Enzyme family)